MDEQKLTQEQLAIDSGVSYHTVFRAVSKGKIPRGKNIGKLADALGVGQDELFREPSKEKQAQTKTKSKSDLVFDIIALLPALNEGELRNVLSNAQSSPSILRPKTAHRKSGL